MSELIVSSFCHDDQGDYAFTYFKRRASPFYKHPMLQNYKIYYQIEIAQMLTNSSISNANDNNNYIEEEKSHRKSYDEPSFDGGYLVEEENQKLRHQVLDLELKQRDYVTKILQLETKIASMKTQVALSSVKKGRSSIEFGVNQNLLGSEPKTKSLKEVSNEQKKFCEVMSKTYNELFGISTLKQIWKKHKEILADWMLNDQEEV